MIKTTEITINVPLGLSSEEAEKIVQKAIYAKMRNRTRRLATKMLIGLNFNQFIELKNEAWDRLEEEDEARR